MKEELFRRGLAVALINLEHEPELDVLQAVHGASSAIATPHRVDPVAWPPRLMID